MYSIFIYFFYYILFSHRIKLFISEIQKIENIFGESEKEIMVNYGARLKGLLNDTCVYDIDAL